MKRSLLFAVACLVSSTAAAQDWGMLPQPSWVNEPLYKPTPMFQYLPDYPTPSYQQYGQPEWQYYAPPTPSLGRQSGPNAPTWQYYAPPYRSNYVPRTNYFNRRR
jgi:hypothetical protein